MNQSLSALYNYVNRHLYPILLILFVLWICIGVFPLQCYEDDGREIILGCETLYREGLSLPPIYSYEYRMQPLMTVVVVALRHLMPFLTCEQIYSLLTALSSIVFLLGTIELGRRITGEGHVRLLLAAMLLPEMYAIAMYANTAIPAAACLVWAFWLACRERYGLSVALMCLAPLFRVDVIIVYPAIFPLLLHQGKPFWKAFLISLAYGVAVVVVPLVLFWAMRADVLSTFFNYQRWNDIITPELRFYAIWGFYSLAYFLLLPLGLCVLLGRRKWLELFVLLSPIVLLHGVYAEFGNASKHFLYAAPFVVMVGARAIGWIQEATSRRLVLRWGVVVAALLFLTISVRSRHRDIVWLEENPLTHVGIVAPIAEFDVAGRAIALSLGAGSQVITRDEYMLGTGHFFYSWYIHSLKCIMKEWRHQEKEVLDKAPSADILTLEWGASAPVSYDQLYRSDSHFIQESGLGEKYRFTIAHPERKLRFWRVYLTEAEHSDVKVQARIDSLVSTDFVLPEAYVVASSQHFGTSPYLDELVVQGRVEKMGDKIYRVCRQN